MVTVADISLEVDLHRLQLRFADTRVADPRAVEQLAQSIERCGQLQPCIAVPAGEETEESSQSWVLVDGYRRVAALRRLGRDTACIQVWRCGLVDGLLQTMVYAQARRFDPIEEALLVRELVEGFGLSQSEVARRSARDVSWVNRRLGLLTGLPQECLQAVREGALSCWAATRVLAPLARANAAHATALLQATAREALSTRDLAKWFSHYQRATRQVRERMVVEPTLFLKALQAQEQDRKIEELSAGPEGMCVKDLRHLDAVIYRLRRRLAMLSGQELSGELLEMLRRVRASLVSWCEDIERYEHDTTAYPQLGTDPVPSGKEPTGDHERPGPLAQHRPSYRQGGAQESRTGNARGIAGASAPPGDGA